MSTPSERFVMSIFWRGVWALWFVLAGVGCVVSAIIALSFGKLDIAQGLASVAGGAIALGFAIREFREARRIANGATVDKQQVSTRVPLEAA